MAAADDDHDPWGQGLPSDATWATSVDRGFPRAVRNAVSWQRGSQTSRQGKASKKAGRSGSAGGQGVSRFDKRRGLGSPVTL